MSRDDPRAPAPDPSAGDPIPAAPHPYSYVTLRFTAEEFEQVARAARTAGQTLPDFGHDTLLAAVAGA
jgi:hypothetical protein